MACKFVSTNNPTNKPMAKRYIDTICFDFDNTLVTDSHGFYGPELATNSRRIVVAAHELVAIVILLTGNERADTLLQRYHLGLEFDDVIVTYDSSDSGKAKTLVSAGYTVDTAVLFDDDFDWCHGFRLSGGLAYQVVKTNFSTDLYSQWRIFMAAVESGQIELID
jgi:hypothetical protein